jgi:P-type conjugative transfer protein TrbL
MEAFSHVIDRYCHVLSSYNTSFLKWGQIVFASLLVLNVAWTCLWYAFDKSCLTHSLSAFIKHFMGILLFYTLMLHPNWLFSLLQSVEYMGKSLTGIPVDPSSLIHKGIAISNKVLASVATSSLLTLGISAIVILLAYLVINFTFITIALDLALTIIITTALISLSSFFLGFSSLASTTPVARQVLSLILANCFRLLGLYLVVGVGSHAIEEIAKDIPARIIAFDPYVWVVAACLLFWLLAKNLPNQLARLGSIASLDHYGTDSSALALSTLRISSQMKQASQAAKTAFSASSLPQLAKVAGSTLYSAVMQTAKHHQAGRNPLGAAVKGSQEAASEVAKATFHTLSDHVKQAASKSVGGQGIANSHQAIAGIAERVFTSAEKARLQRSNLSARLANSPYANIALNLNFSSSKKAIRFALMSNLYLSAK